MIRMKQEVHDPFLYSTYDLGIRTPKMVAVSIRQCGWVPCGVPLSNYSRRGYFEAKTPSGASEYVSFLPVHLKHCCIRGFYDYWKYPQVQKT